MKDIRRLDNGDVDLSGGDIVYSEATKKHITDELKTSEGELKHSPTSGIDIFSFVNDDEPEELLIKARRRLTADGMKISSLYIQEGTLKVDGNYEDN